MEHTSRALSLSQDYLFRNSYTGILHGWWEMITSDLLCAPSCIILPHVGGWFHLGHKFEDSVADTNENDQGAGNVFQSRAFKDQTANKDVDCSLLASSA